MPPSESSVGAIPVPIGAYRNDTSDLTYTQRVWRAQLLAAEIRDRKGWAKVRRLEVPAT